jgi:hypothetical protein
MTTSYASEICAFDHSQPLGQLRRQERMFLADRGVWRTCERPMRDEIFAAKH